MIASNGSSPNALSSIGRWTRNQLFEPHLLRKIQDFAIDPLLQIDPSELLRREVQRVAGEGFRGVIKALNSRNLAEVNWFTKGCAERRIKPSVHLIQQAFPVVSDPEFEGVEQQLHSAISDRSWDRMIEIARPFFERAGVIAEDRIIESLIRAEVRAMVSGAEIELLKDLFVRAASWGVGDKISEWTGFWERIKVEAYPFYARLFDLGEREMGYYRFERYFSAFLEHKDWGRLKVLLNEEGAPADGDFEKALVGAIKAQEFELAKLLKERINYFGSIFYKAIEENDLETIQFVCEIDPDTEKFPFNRWELDHAINEAERLGREEIVQLLKQVYAHPCCPTRVITIDSVIDSIVEFFFPSRFSRLSTLQKVKEVALFILKLPLLVSLLTLCPLLSLAFLISLPCLWVGKKIFYRAPPEEVQGDLL